MPPGESPGWVFGGCWLLLLAGTVLVGGPWAGFHGILLGGAGLLMALFPPRVALPRRWWWLAGCFVVAGAAPLLPATWFPMPEWRGQLAAAGVAIGSQITLQPQQTVEMLGLFAFTLLAGLWLAGHRASAAQLRVWSLAFTLGVAGYAVLAKVMQPPPVSDIPGGGVIFGFFPNRNHTGTYLAMGVVCGVGCAFQAIRDKRIAAAALGLLGTGVGLWAVAGWSISRGGLVLAVVGCLVKGGEFRRHGHGVRQRGGLVGFELEEDVAAVLNDERDALRLAVEGVARDRGTVQRGGRVEPAGAGQFALFLGFLAHGGLRGDGDPGGRAAFVFAEAERQHEGAHVFAVDGEPAREGAVGGGEPAVDPRRRTRGGRFCRAGCRARSSSGRGGRCRRGWMASPARSVVVG